MRFISLGNWGTNSSQQKTIAETLKKVVSDEHITFFVSPGSNFKHGVTSTQDILWKKAFEDVYNSTDKSMNLLFFTVMGSGDWLGDCNSQVAQPNFNGSEPNKNANDIQNGYPKWTIPNYWYHYFTHFTTTGNTLLSGHKDVGVGFIFIDTWVLSPSFPFNKIHDKAWLELETTLKIASKVVEFIIVVGDKPIYSSGSSKGDSYLEKKLLPLLKMANVDMYIAGHDHDMEVIQKDGISHIICGTGGSYGRKSLIKNDKSMFYSDKSGFCLHELSLEGITTKFINGNDGSVLYTHTQPIKTRKEMSKGNEIKYLSMLPPVVLTPIPTQVIVKDGDAFVKIVGSIGILIALGFATIAVAAKTAT